MNQIVKTLLGLLLAAGFAQATPAAAQYWQCAPYARMISGIELFGNASSWWVQAADSYDRGTTPREGAVLSFKATGRMRAGHVAMVSRVIDTRTIEVHHANWSIIGGSRGQVERNATVIDVSPEGDWSQVRVWYATTGSMGISAYPANGFIYNDAPTTIFAANDTAPRLALNTKGLLAR